MPRSSPTGFRQTPRIALIANPGADLYGSDRMALETVSALVEAGWTVVVTLPVDGPLATAIIARGAQVRICRTPVVRKSLLTFRGMTGFLWDLICSIRPAVHLIRDANPDVVYVNTVIVPLWLLLARLMRRSCVCHVHESEASVAKLILRALNAPLLLAHQVIVNSQFSRSVLLRAAPAVGDRSTVVYNTVDAPRVTEPRAVLSVPYRLLYVGRLSARKGPDVAIDAIRILRDQGVEAVLDVVGAVFPGQERFDEELREKVHAANLSAQVTFRGFDSDVWPYVERADVLIVPSTVDEPFGNTAVEGMLAGRPVVVSRVGGLPEAVAGSASAILVAPRSAQEIADAVCTVIRDWQTFRARAADSAAEARLRFSVAAYAAGIMQAVNTAVDRSSR